MKFLLIALLLIIISKIIIFGIERISPKFELPQTRVCSDCKRTKNIEEFKGQGDSISYEGYFINCMLCRMQMYRKNRNHSYIHKNKVITSKQSKPKTTNDQKHKKDDLERVNNKIKFGKELTNKEILDEFEKENIHLDLNTKTRIENQLNGFVRILELPYEIDVIRKKQFKRLNEIGVWYDVNNKRIVKFPKSEKFWKDAGGRDGSRGIDDWASK